MEFKLPFYVRNGGDGSVTVVPCVSPAVAAEADASMDEVWGESSADTITIKVEDGKLFFRDYQPNEEEQYQYVWVEVTS